MNIIITSGGTKERIDEVRTIANSATGRLGSLIAQQLLRRLPRDGHKIYYLCGAGAAIPEGDDPRVELIQTVDTQALEDTLRSLLRGVRIDAVIHSMAVSDYRVRSVATAELLAEAISRAVSEQPPASPSQWQEMISDALLSCSLGAGGKISSELEHPLIVLEKTPKVIHMIKQVSPETILVGFKLLSNVSEETLSEVAYALLLKNKCDFVFANDTVSLKSGCHEGYLICPDHSKLKFTGKEEIAAGIAGRLLEKLAEVNA